MRALEAIPTARATPVRLCIAIAILRVFTGDSLCAGSWLAQRLVGAGRHFGGYLSMNAPNQGNGGQRRTHPELQEMAVAVFLRNLHLQLS